MSRRPSDAREAAKPLILAAREINARAGMNIHIVTASPEQVLFEWRDQRWDIRPNTLGVVDALGHVTVSEELPRSKKAAMAAISDITGMMRRWQEDHAALMRVMPREFTTRADGTSRLTIHATSSFTTLEHDGEIIAHALGNERLEESDEDVDLGQYFAFTRGGEYHYHNLAAEYIIGQREPLHVVFTWKTGNATVLAYQEGVILIERSRQLTLWKGRKRILICQDARDLDELHWQCDWMLERLQDTEEEA